MNDKDLSLDDTLKELLDESNITEENNVEENVDIVADKPKRGRKPKNSTLEDRKQEDLEKMITTQDEIPEDPISAETSDSAVEIFTPEIIEDSKDDIGLDISVETESNSTIQESVEVLVPEVIEDTAEDKIPDVEETKETSKSKKTTKMLKNEAKEAFKDYNNSKESNKGMIGRSVVLKDLTPTYRAKHISMRTKPYRGLVTIIENAKNGFFKVQFLRASFGLCESYIEERFILNALEGDSNETLVEEKK